MEYAKDLEGGASEAVRNVAFEAEATIKKLTPVITGNLRGSIHTRFPIEVSDKIAIIGTPVEYAPFVEGGTVRFAGRHMFKRGMMSVRGKLIRRLKKAMQDSANG